MDNKKKLILFTIVLTCLLSCSEDLTEYYTRLDQREIANKSQEQANSKQEQQNVNQQNKNQQLRLEGEELRRRLTELEQSLVTVPDPKMRSVYFFKEENPGLSGNVKCDILGDSIIDCWLPGGIRDEKLLVPRFDFDGTLVLFDGIEAKSGVTKVDCMKPVKVLVLTTEKQQEYTMYVHSYTGLPILYITTSGRQAITSKDYYLNAQFRLVEDVKTRSAGDVISTTVQIKGRGNSSWQQPKKGYRLKFNEKVSLLGEHKDKSWVLITNYSDKSMVRNRTACFMSSISMLDYTPKSHFVELVLNGTYNGTYELCEKIKISNHRVAVGDDGFLLEIDIRAPEESSACFFRTNYLENCVNIKEPEVHYNDDNFNYIQGFFFQAEAALFGSNFKDLSIGWQKYLDINSFVDWYLINEISKNLDALFWSSCYMNLKRGGKLKMGPVWDFDVAFGNINQDNQTCFLPSGFYIKNVRWYSRLFQDPAFVSKVKERFSFFYNHKDEIFAYINSDAQYLKYAVSENENRWGTLYTYTWSNYDIWGSYQNEVQSLKEWLNTRMDWLKTQFDKM